MVSEVEWVSPLGLGSSCRSSKLLAILGSSCLSSKLLAVLLGSSKLLARASRDKAEPSQSLLTPDLRLSREGGVDSAEGGVVGDDAVVEREGGVGEWWRGGDDL